MNIVEILGLAIVGALPIAAVYFGGKLHDERERVIGPTRRKEIVNGIEYSVYTLEHPVVREARTGRLGILLEGGTDARWIRVQFFRKSDGEPGRLEWRGSAKFEIVGKGSVDYLSRGFMGFDSLKRYNLDLAALRNATMSKGRRPSSVVVSKSRKAPVEQPIQEHPLTTKFRNANEQYRLGEAYSTGAGMPQNHARATRWWHKAAEQDHAAAQHCLALCYIEGLGIQRDLTQAYMWLAIIQTGDDLPGHDRIFFNPAADELMKTIEIEMTAAELEIANRRAEDWRANRSRQCAPPGGPKA